MKEFAHSVKTVLRGDQTVDEAIDYLRGKRVDDKIIYFYVVDEEERLQGIVSARTLLLKSSHLKISQIMDKAVVRLSGEQTLEEAIESMTSHRLLAVPVVDEEGRFLGVIDVQLYLEESTNIENTRFRGDVFQILGMTLEEGRKRRILKSYAARMPWIFCNLLGGLACAAISHFYEIVLAKMIILAMFIPLVLTVSESISMQSMSQSLALLRKSRITWRRMAFQGYQEWKIVSLLSLTCGVIVGFLSLLWNSNPLAAISIGVGLALSISLSALIGSCIPFLLHVKELDPKLAAGPVVLMCTDVLTTTIYLSLATYLLL